MNSIFFLSSISSSGNPGCHQPSLQNSRGDPTLCEEAARTAEDQISRGVCDSIRDLLVISVSYSAEEFTALLLNQGLFVRCLVCKLSTCYVTFCADGPWCHGGETVTGRVHSAEDGNPHSLEKTGREGDECSQQRCDVFPQVDGWFTASCSSVRVNT